MDWKSMLLNAGILFFICALTILILFLIGLANPIDYPNFINSTSWSGK